MLTVSKTCEEVIKSHDFLLPHRKLKMSNFETDSSPSTRTDYAINLIFSDVLSSLSRFQINDNKLISKCSIRGELAP